SNKGRRDQTTLTCLPIADHLPLSISPWGDSPQPMAAPALTRSKFFRLARVSVSTNQKAVCRSAARKGPRPANKRPSGSQLVRRELAPAKRTPASSGAARSSFGPRLRLELPSAWQCQSPANEPYRLLSPKYWRASGHDESRRAGAHKPPLRIF